MAEELFDMSSRVDPNPPPPPICEAADDAGDAPTSTAPPKELVTRFVVKPAAEPHEEPTNTESDGGGIDGGGAVEDGVDETLSKKGGRSDSAYWAGGVALHYQRLEDEYV